LARDKLHADLKRPACSLAGSRIESQIRLFTAYSATDISSRRGGIVIPEGWGRFGRYEKRNSAIETAAISATFRAERNVACHKQIHINAEYAGAFKERYSTIGHAVGVSA